MEKFFRSKIKVTLALIVPTILVYYKSLFFDFTTLDEQWMIVQNAQFLESIESFKTSFTQPLAGLYYRPLLLMTVILDYHIGKLSPFIYHFTNLVWHVASVLLFYKFLKLYKVDIKIAFLFAVLFSVHPLTLHAVAWVPGRNDLILCVFVLASFIYLKKYFDTEKKSFLVFHLLFFLLALASKENAIILPLIYGAAWWVYNRAKIKDITYPFAAWILLASGWFALRNTVVSNTPPLDSALLPHVKYTLEALLMYLGKTIYPFSLSVFPMLKNTSLLPGILALITLIVLYLKFGAKDKKTTVFGILFFFTLIIIPVWYNGTGNTREHYEHRAYVPLLGIMFFFSQLNFNPTKKITTYILSAIIIVFCVRTFYRMNAYKDKETFLSYAIKESPDHYLFQMQMGEKCYDSKDYAASINYFSKAIEIRPNKYELYNNRGTAYFMNGMYKEAITDLTKAIDNLKFSSAYYINRCASYYAIGDIKNAMKDLSVLINCCREVIPEDLKTGVIQKWVSTETASLTKQMLSEPKNAALYFKRAQIYLSTGNLSRGIEDLKKATELDPDNEEYLKLFLKKSGEALGK